MVLVPFLFGAPLSLKCPKLLYALCFLLHTMKLSSSYFLQEVDSGKQIRALSMQLSFE